MAKGKHARKSRKRTSVSVALKPTAGDREIIAKKIARFNMFFAGIALLPGAYVFVYNTDKSYEMMGWVYYLCLGAVFILCSIGIWLNQSIINIREGSTQFSTNAARIRKFGVWATIISIFLNFTVIIPILYMEGYLAQLINLFPVKEQLRGKLSLALAFGLGAIISGVLGNAAYDLIKFVVKKRYNRK